MTFPIFEKVGGIERAMGLVETASGKLPTAFARAKWHTERRLPAKIALPLARECERRGIAWSEDDFVLTTPERVETAE